MTCTGMWAFGNVKCVCERERKKERDTLEAKGKNNSNVYLVPNNWTSMHNTVTSLDKKHYFCLQTKACQNTWSSDTVVAYCEYCV